MTLLDLEPADRLAMSVRRQSVELAGAPVGAVAVDELTSLDGPFGVRHRRLLRGTLGKAVSTEPRSKLNANKPVGLGSKAERLRISKCSPLCLRKRAFRPARFFNEYTP